jgi:multidrug resistance efflux pump
MPVYSRRKRPIIKVKKNKTTKSRYNKGMRGGYELLEIQSEYDDAAAQEQENKRKEREQKAEEEEKAKIAEEEAKIAKAQKEKDRPDTLFKGTVIGNSIADNFMTNVGKKIDNTRNSIIQSFQNKQPTEEEEKQKCRVLLGITEGGRRTKNYKKKRTNKKK